MNRRIDWKDEKVMEIITNPYLTLAEMADKIGVDYYYLSKKRKDLGLGRVYYGCYGHRSTNTERVRRYRNMIKKLRNRTS